MTTIVPKTVTCAVCGRKSEVSIICSTNAFGSPDLDLRPPEMQRSTMGLWVQECPYCHYAASYLQEPYEGAADRLTAADYLDCSKLEQLPESARKFYRYHLLRLEQADWEGAFSGALWTAWCCDDAGDDKNAARLRCEALSALERFVTSPETDEQRWVLRADLLRRTCQFDKLIAEYASFKSDEEILDQIIAFQIELARAKDSGCHLVREAVEQK